MAVTSSPRLGLTRWGAGTDPLRRSQLDADHAALDDLVAIYDQGPYNARPAAGVAGRFYHAPDAPGGGADGLVYYDDGAVWRLVGSPPPDLSGYATDAELNAVADTANAAQTTANAALPKAGGTITGDLVVNGKTTLGDADTDVVEQRAAVVETHTRTTTNTYTAGKLTQVVEKAGATTVRTTTLTYTGDQLTQVQEVAGGKTITTTLTYTGSDLTGTSRTVA